MRTRNRSEAEALEQHARQDLGLEEGHVLAETNARARVELDELVLRHSLPHRLACGIRVRLVSLRDAAQQSKPVCSAIASQRSGLNSAASLPHTDSRRPIEYGA